LNYYKNLIWPFFYITITPLIIFILIISLDESLIEESIINGF